MGVGTSYDYTLTRDEVVKAAYRKIDHDAPNEGRIKFGVIALNLIMREMDPDVNILWAITPTPATITLIANTFIYTSSNGLATNILRLETMVYRDPSGSDVPLAISTNETYQAVTDKFQLGDPQLIYLTEDLDLSARQLFVAPMLSSVNSQSEVTGSGALNWQCIRSHTADSTNKPVTGDNHLLYWVQAGSSGSAWVDGTSYTAPQQLRYTYRKPLWDFDLARDNPDIPQSWIRMLTLRLASDLADELPGVSVEKSTILEIKSDKAKRAVKSTTVKNTNNFHDKVEFF